MVGACARQMVDSFEDGRVIEIDEEMARLTLAIVVKSLFGADVTREAEEVGGLMVAVLDAANDRLNQVLRLPSWVPTRRNLREKRALARLDEMLRRVHRGAPRLRREAGRSAVGAARRGRRGQRHADVGSAAPRRDDDAVSGGPRNDGDGADVDVVPAVAAS